MQSLQCLAKRSFASFNPGEVHGFVMSGTQADPTFVAET